MSKQKLNIRWPIGRFLSSTPTPRQLKAVRALRELVDAEGIDSVNCVYAEAVSERRLKEWTAKNGREINGHRCTRRILDLRCNGGKGCDGGNYPVPGSDHVTFWRREGAPPIYVSQPYALTLSDTRDLVAYADRHNLDVTVSPYSFYFPGETLMIKVQRRGGTGK